MSECSVFPPTLNVSSSDRLYTQNACGLMGNTSTIPKLASCCNTETLPEPADDCWAWCPYNGTLRDFAECLGSNDTNTSVSSAFCQGMPTIQLNLNEACNEEQTSGAFRAMRRPALSSLLVLLTLCLFITGSAASPFDSISSLLIPRQAIPAEPASGINTTCGAATASCGSWMVNGTSYTTTTSRRVTNVTACDSPPCFLNVTVADQTTGSPVYFNRTLNGQDASNGSYDALFGLIFGSGVAASVGYQTTYEYVAQGSTFLNIFAYMNCLQGTIGECSSDVGMGITNGSSVTACEVMSLNNERGGIGQNGSTEAGRVPRVAFNVVLTS